MYALSTLGCISTRSDALFLTVEVAKMRRVGFGDVWTLGSIVAIREQPSNPLEVMMSARFNPPIRPDGKQHWLLLLVVKYLRCRNVTSRGKGRTHAPRTAVSCYHERGECLRQRTLLSSKLHIQFFMHHKFLYASRSRNILVNSALEPVGYIMDLRRVQSCGLVAGTRVLCQSVHYAGEFM